MSSRSKRRSRTVPAKRTMAAVETQADLAVVPYDEHLLERARTQWQFGDWDSLIKLDRNTLQHHPDRAKLALLTAAGHLQIGNPNEGMQYIRLAKDWGCSKKLLLQILAAGVHNSLGRAAARSGQQQRAFEHFEQAIRLGTPGNDTRLITQARSSEQFAQLSLNSSNCPTGEPRNILANTEITAPFQANRFLPDSPVSIEKFFSDCEGDRQEALEDLKQLVANLSPTANVPETAWSFAHHRNKTFFFAHFAGDYIPAKIAEKNQFYEAHFLNLLARLHVPGKLIVDCGANIGNHSIFFAGILGDQVISFEPQPYNYIFLLSNAYINRLEHKIDAKNIAVGDKKGKILISQAIPDNYGSFTSDSNILENNNLYKNQLESFEVEVSLLDNELEGCRGNVSIIKVDIEGMEIFALRGASQVIAESLPVIAVECFTKSSFNEIKEYLSMFDYFVIDSINATPTFIFLSRKNPIHLEKLTAYLEMSSTGKYSSSKSFNEIAT